MGFVGIGIGAILIIAAALLFVFWLWMLIDCLKRPDDKFAAGGNYAKLIWVLVIIFTWLIGALIYYFLIKKADTQNELYIYLTFLIIITIINSLLSRFAIISWQIAPGVAGLYFAVAFMIAFTLWFGIWGAIAAYIGCFIGAGMTAGMPPNVNAFWSLADLWQVLIPLIAFRTLGADVGLKTKRDFLIFLVFGLVLNNLAGAGWGAITFTAGGISWRQDIFVGWLTGNLIVTIVITPLLLRYITPFIRRSGIYVKNYWI